MTMGVPGEKNVFEQQEVDFSFFFFFATHNRILGCIYNRLWLIDGSQSIDNWSAIIFDKRFIV